MLTIGAAAGGLLLLAAAGVMLSRRRAPAVQATGPAELPAASETAQASSTAPGPAAVETTPEADLETRLEAREALQQKLDAQTLQSLKLAPVITKTAEVMAKHLREKIAKEPDISAQILRTWIREEDDR